MNPTYEQAQENYAQMARTILMYGASNTYKTSNIGEFAEHVYQSTGGITRLLSADSGWHPVQSQIDRGFIHAWNLNSAMYPLAMLVKVSKGFWPTRIDADGKADESSLALTTVEQWKGSEEFAGIGAYAIEGLTMIGELLLSDLTGKQRQTGEPLVGVFEEQGEKFASASRGTYQFAQKATREYVFRLKSLPCKYVLVTGHEGRGDDDSKRPVYGPAIVGKAANEKTPAWFEMTIHHELFISKATLKGGAQVLRPSVQAYFQSHPDPEIPTKFWPAKTALAPVVQAQLLQRFPTGSYAVRMDEAGNYVSGLHTFVQTIEELEAAQATQDAPQTNEPAVDESAPAMADEQPAGQAEEMPEQVASEAAEQLETATPQGEAEPEAKGGIAVAAGAQASQPIRTATRRRK